METAICLWVIGWMFTCGMAHEVRPKLTKISEWILMIIILLFIWPAAIGSEAMKVLNDA